MFITLWDMTKCHMLFLFLFAEKTFCSPHPKKREKKSNWKARRAVMSFSVFFVFGQQLNPDQSERATKTQTVEKELQRWDTFFQLYAEGKTSKAKTQNSASTLLIK